MLGPKGSWNTTVVPDSEDERRRVVEKHALGDVIEISDSSDEESSQPAPRPRGKWDLRSPSKPPSHKKPPSTSSNTGVTLGQWRRSRRVESSDSETEPDDSNERPAPSRKTHRKSMSREERAPALASGSKPLADVQFFLKRETSSMIVEIDSDSDPLNEPDDAIMILDEPPSARKPLRKPIPKTSVKLDVKATTTRVQIALPTTSRDIFGISDSTNSEVDTPAKAAAPKPTPRKKAAPSGTPKPRVSKKQKKEQQENLYNYAASLFAELNRTVFKQGLPEDTKLNWNNRLLTTAGRAKWHKSRDGVQTSEIELAEKILTSRERIRNTLSHEMCHLASWVIDKQIKEGHGQYWKAWTRRVMNKYPDIDISTRHDYEIEYPYKWKCAKCEKIYGRFSKSIKPDECVCGACREGKLVAQFKTRTRTATTDQAKTPIMSRMAAAKTQGSPYTPSKRSMPGEFATPTVGVAVETIYIGSDSEDDDADAPPVRPYHKRASICEIAPSSGEGEDDCCASDDDDEVEILATTLTAAKLDD